jgi:hypothetical protein
MEALVLALALAATASPDKAGKARIPWSRDYVQSYTQAEERGAPLLIHFRGENCGTRSVPTAIEEGTRPVHATDLNDCDLMEQEVWEADRIARATERFVPVLVDGGDQKLNVRYQVIVSPTTLITDPWGNEMFRVSGYLDPDKVDRLLKAIPTDFSSLRPSAVKLRERSDDVKALLGAAAYYEGHGLRQVSERLYEKAFGSPALDADLAARRQVAISRGLNLLLMGRDKDAAGVFQKALAEAPEGPGADAILLGLVNAHLQGSRRKEAEAALKSLEKGWPGSPYAARARQNFEGAKK